MVMMVQITVFRHPLRMFRVLLCLYGIFHTMDSMKHKKLLYKIKCLPDYFLTGI